MSHYAVQDKLTELFALGGRIFRFLGQYSQIFQSSSFQFVNKFDKLILLQLPMIDRDLFTIWLAKERKVKKLFASKSLAIWNEDKMARLMFNASTVSSFDGQMSRTAPLSKEKANGNFSRSLTRSKPICAADGPERAAPLIWKEKEILKTI
uniref:Uncharacterized protein n=1 Tax=Romanomermis culicivorax TaxID=13658 RepID=A0A915L5G0_ROMCU